MRKWFIFTVWIEFRNGSIGRVVRRTLGRTDEPHHESLKADVSLTFRANPEVEAVSFGPIGVSKHQTPEI